MSDATVMSIEAYKDLVRCDQSLQMRYRFDIPTVLRYLDILRAWHADDGDDACPLPPITLGLLGDALYLVDGWHRAAAWTKLIDELDAPPLSEFIQVSIIPCATRRDLVRLAARANARHGLPLITAEKRRAVEAWVGTETAADADLLSAREVARELGVSHTLVAEVRREYAEKSRQESSASTTDSSTELPPLPPCPDTLTTPTDRLRWDVLCALAEAMDGLWGGHATMPIAAIESRTERQQLKISLRSMAKAGLIIEATPSSHVWQITDAGQQWLNDRGTPCSEDTPDTPPATGLQLLAWGAQILRDYGLAGSMDMDDLLGYLQDQAQENGHRLPDEPFAAIHDAIDQHAPMWIDEHDQAQLGKPPANTPGSPRTDPPAANGTPEITHPVLPTSEKPPADIEAEDQEAADLRAAAARRDDDQRAAQLLKRWNAHPPLLTMDQACAIVLAVGIDAGTRTYALKGAQAALLDEAASAIELTLDGTYETTAITLDQIADLIPDHQEL